jgi:hypothetical protein
VFQDTKYDRLAALSDEHFRRLTGVKRATFAAMVEDLVVAEEVKKSEGGRPSKLCVEDRLLMALEYLREYRTYFHIGLSYGVSEGTAWKICRWVEDVLIKDERFHLPGKKALLGSGEEFSVVKIDVTESPVERPKKGRGATTLGRRSATR